MMRATSATAAGSRSALLRERMLTRLVSLKTRLLLLVALPAMLVLLVLVWAGTKIVRQNEQAEFRHARSAARTAEVNLERQILEGRQFLELLAQMAPLLHPERPAECHATLAQMHAHYPQYQNLGFIDRKGNLLCSALPGQGNFSDRPWVRKVLTSGVFAVGPYQIGRITKKPNLPLGYPVATSRQQPAALAFAVASLSWVDESLRHTALPPGSRAAVVDERGIVLHHYPEGGAVRPGEKFTLFDMAALLAGQAEAETQIVGFDGVLRHYLVQRAELGENHLHLAIGIPVAELRREAWTIGRQLLAWVAGLSLLTLGLALWGIRVAVTDKLERLGAAVRRMAGGDLAARADIGPGRGELRQLATAFDGMAASLQSLRNLQGVILDSVSEGIYGLDEQGRLIFINEAGARLLGYAPVELIGYPADGTICRQLPDPSDAEDPGGTRSALYQHKNGDSLPVEYSASPLLEGGRRIGTVVVFADVSQRRAMEIELRRSEARFRGLFEAAPDAMLIVDEAGRIEAASQQAEALFGYPRAELIGQPVELLLPEAQRPQHAALRQSYRQQPQTRRMGQGRELQARRKDGRLLPVAISLSPLQVGDSFKVISAVRDITVARQQRDELRRREQELLTLTDNLPDLVLRFDHELCCLFANALAEKTTGLPRNALIGRRWPDIPELAGLTDACLAPVRRTLADGQARALALSCPTPLGTRQFELRLVPEQVAADGAPATVLLIGRDVTTEKEAAAAVRHNEVRIARSQEVVSFGYWEWNRETGQRHWSDEVYRILGLDPARHGNRFEDFLARVHPDDRERVGATITAALANGRRYQLEYRVVRPDGSERTLVEIGDASRDADGQVIGIEGPLFDMTERRQLQDTIRELKQSLEQQAAGEGAVAAYFSRPLHAIDRLSSLLLDEEKEMLRNIRLPKDKRNG